MASQKQFAITPTVSITRSKFKRPSQNKTTFKLGELVPIYVDEVLPGDTRTIDIAGVVRMVQPITDVMDNCFLDVTAWFVPNRIIWSHFKEFMGENTTGAGAQTGDYSVPMREISGLPANSLGAYMGLPVGLQGTTTKVSCLPGRAYIKIYNEFWRDQNIIAPIVEVQDDGGYLDGLVGTYAQSCQKVAKVSDYFTRSLPYAQKGNAVTLPLGTSAPVKVGTEGYSVSAGKTILTGEAGSALTGGVNLKVEGGTLENSKVYADLSDATAATINDLRFAFAYQKLLEKDARAY